MRMPVLLPSAVFFAFIFLFFLFGIDPRLVFHAQEPAFLFDAEFFNGFAGYPGGLVWYASAFLTQIYRLPFAGACLFTLLMLLMFRETVVFLKSWGIRRNREAAGLVPPALLVAAYSDYLLPLSYALGILAALFCSNIYASLRSGRPYLRLFLFSIMASAVYYLTGTGVLLLAALCIMNELVVRKSPAVAAAAAAVAALLPFVAARFFFVISVQSAYGDCLGLKTALLEAARYPRLPPLAYSVFFFYPSAAALSFLFSLKKASPPENRHNGMVRCGVLIAVIVAAITYALFFRFDETARADYRIDCLARHRLWDELLSIVRPADLSGSSVMSQAHLFRALFWRGRLLSELFAYPGALPGLSFQMVTGAMASRYPVQMSDFYFEIGALNQAEYWAHEAMAMKGKMPYILKRLALINLLKGRKNSARKFMALLERTPFEKRTAAACARLLEDDFLIAGDAYLSRVRSSMPRREYVCRDYYAEIVHLFEDNSDNRTAFEYIVAENLLNNSISPVVDNTGYFARFGYDRFPRHVQEALVFQLVASKAEQAVISSYNLDSDLFRKFDDFNRVLLQYKDDRAAALNKLAPAYGTTYWFYLASSGRPVLLKRDG